jgi:hypothetical protein
MRVSIPAISAGYRRLCGLQASLQAIGVSIGYRRLCRLQALLSAYYSCGSASIATLYIIYRHFLLLTGYRLLLFITTPTLLTTA